jgi:hypothetical protein
VRETRDHARLEAGTHTYTFTVAGTYDYYPQLRVGSFVLMGHKALQSSVRDGSASSSSPRSSRTSTGVPLVGTGLWLPADAPVPEEPGRRRP